MKSFFITSSGTGIGKTFIVCSMIRKLKSEGKSVFALKPVISGFNNDDNNDVKQILQSLELPYTQENINKVSLYRFSAYLSPDMAAKKENRKIDFQKIVNFCNSISGYDYLLIEGIGGVMVPLTKKYTTLELIKRLCIPAIIVVGSYLGSLSHTLTALETLQSHKVKIDSVVVNEPNENETTFIPINDTISTLRNFTREQIKVVS